MLSYLANFPNQFSLTPWCFPQRSRGHSFWRFEPSLSLHVFPIKPKTNNQSRQQRQNEREKKEDKSKEQSTKGYFTLVLLDFNSRRCKLKIIKHTAPDFTKDNKVPPVQSSFYLNTPKMQSGFLEVISDQLRLCAEEHADIPPLTCISLSLSPFHFVSPGERSRRVLRAGKCKTWSVVTSRRKWLQEVSQTWANGHASSWTQWQTQHQAMALTYGRSSTTNFHHLLQFQRQWKGAKAKSDGQVIRSLDVAQWGWGPYGLWILYESELSPSRRSPVDHKYCVKIPNRALCATGTP